MQRQCRSPCSLFSCQISLCTKMLIGPNPPLKAVLVAWPHTLKDTLVWNTKEPIQVAQKRGTVHSNTIQFPSWKRKETRGGVGGRGEEAAARMDLRVHRRSDNKLTPQKNQAAVQLPNLVLAATSRNSHSPTGHRNANCLNSFDNSPSYLRWSLQCLTPNMRGIKP